MKRDTEIIRDLLLWLLDDPKPTGLSSSSSLSGSDLEESASDVSGELWDPFESEALSIADLDPDLLGPAFKPQPVSLGEIPAVQDRFQALIKRRLRLEIERRPPLFPWEKEVQDYPEWLGEASTAPVWLSHLHELKIPAILPDEVMATLLKRCQTLAQQPLKSGIRLIQAVESLFPDQPQTLEHVARLVLTPAYRSGSSVENLDLDYSTANTQQQVALAMMAAQEIFNTLTLSLSANAPEAQQQWLTTAGLLILTATYEASTPGEIQVRAVLPTAGYLQWQEEEAEARTACDQPGELVLRLDAPQSGQIHSLEIGLAIPQSEPLQFALCWLDDSKS
ncbi:MAG TPA: hypothetical protein V6D29_04850 [Leptolyngbyaceae cyanobacterium]